MAPLALLFALIAGFAIQRGGVCAVRAVREGVEERDWRRFSALLECSAWSLLLLLAAAGAGVMDLRAWPAQPSWALAAAGGAIFGLGALVNGACALGTVGRLAAGEAAFLATPIGFVAGVLGARALGARFGHAVISAAPQFATYVLAAALVAFALYRAWVAWRAAPNLGAISCYLAAPHWPPALAMAVTAFANIGLLLLILGWPYTSLLVDAVSGVQMSNALRAGLALLFLGGATLGAVAAGRFALRAASIATVLACLLGGALMGAGAALVPGGNDALIFVGLPLLQPSAFVAYMALVGVIAAGFVMRRRMRRAATAPAA